MSNVSSKILSKLKRKDRYTLLELMNNNIDDVYEAKEILLKILHDQISSIPLNNLVNNYKYIYKIFKYLGDVSSEKEKTKIISKLNECLRICEVRISSASKHKKTKDKTAVLEKIRDIIQVTLLDIEYQDINDNSQNVAYKLLKYLIFYVKNYNYLYEIIETFPEKIIAKNKSGKYMIETLIERYAKAILKENNQEEIIYLEKVIKLFVDNPKLRLENKETERIVSLLNNQIEKIDDLKISNECKLNILFFINEVISYINKKIYTSSEVEELIYDVFNILGLDRYKDDDKSFILGYFNDLVKIINLDSFDINVIKKLNNYVTEIENLNIEKKDKSRVRYLHKIIIKYISDLSMQKSAYDYLKYKYVINEDEHADILKEADKIVIDNGEMLLDCTDKFTVTIDNPGTYLYDDAISIETLHNGYKLLGIYLADAASYIKRGSLLDSRAMNLGQTIYLPGHNISMFPEEIVNKLTLKMGEKRRAFGYFFLFDKNLCCRQFEVKKCLIEVNQNFSYDLANTYITDSRSIEEIKTLREMYDISRQINKYDESIEEYRKVKNLKNSLLNEEVNLDTLSSTMIVNFMVFINSFVADFFSNHPELPFIYRNNLIGFNEKNIRRVTEIIKGNYNYKDIIDYVKNLNSPSTYSIHNQGHKKLKLAAYSHLSNPLRNYCSLELQRLVEKYIINGDLSVTQAEILYLEKLCKYLNTRMQMNDEYCSEIEELNARRNVKMLTK